MNNCGNCKWLNVPNSEITSQGKVHKRCAYRVYHCLVPFTPPAFPASWTADVRHRMMCPTYGEGCSFHERRIPGTEVATGTTE